MGRAQVVGSHLGDGRGRGVPALARAGVVLLFALAAVLPVIADAGAAAPKWVARPVPAVNDFPLKSVSCSGASCLALASECSPGGCGGLLPARAFFTSNFGVSWGDAPVNGPVGNATPVSCGAPTLCVATAYRGPLGPNIASAIIVSRNGGKSWATHVEAPYNLDEAACASSTACVALGSPKSSTSATTVALVSTNAGQTWAKGSVPDKGYLGAVACGTPTDCVAVGSTLTSTGVVLVSANVGRSWTPMPVPAGTFGLRAVSCDVLVCSAMSATQFLVSVNGGKSWRLHPLPGGLTFEGSSCLSATHCVIVGYQDATSHTVPVAELSPNGGVSWSNQVLPHRDGSLNSVACERTSCVAAGASVIFSGTTAKAEYPLIFTY